MLSWLLLILFDLVCYMICCAVKDLINMKQAPLPDDPDDQCSSCELVWGCGWRQD
jgi:hypothetical protein